MIQEINLFLKYGVAALKKRPVYVFHHIPKCGGSSVRVALKSWFKVVEDNRNPAWSKDELVAHKKNLNSLRKMNCLIGHFDVPYYFLKDRYPEIIDNNNFFLFTFLRDPLEVKLSLYFYEKRMKRNLSYSLEERLFSEKNYMSSRFPCDESNYKKVLERYDFIGITEESQKSLNLLASLIDKPMLPILKKNETPRNITTKDLPPSLVSKFKSYNTMDYRIYNYALNKLIT